MGKGIKILVGFYAGALILASVPLQAADLPVCPPVGPENPFQGGTVSRVSRLNARLMQENYGRMRNVYRLAA